MCQGSGNTKPRPENPCTKWFFTLNNHTDDEVFQLIEFCKNRTKNYAFQEERGESGTPHLQGCFQLKSKCRLEGVKKLLPRAHWEHTKLQKASEWYCLDITKRDGREWTNLVRPKPLKLITNLYDWQKNLIKKLEEEPNDRTVIWITDPIGGNGKSQLAKYIIANYKAIIVGGRAEDMFNGINNYEEDKKEYPEIVLIMLARDSKKVCYEGLEMIKDGLFYNSKFKGKQHIFNSPHIVVFANNSPNYGRLTADRWDEIKLSTEDDIESNAE